MIAIISKDSISINEALNNNDSARTRFRVSKGYRYLVWYLIVHLTILICLIYNSLLLNYEEKYHATTSLDHAVCFSIINFNSRTFFWTGLVYFGHCAGCKYSSGDFRCEYNCSKYKFWNHNRYFRKVLASCFSRDSKCTCCIPTCRL